MKTRFFALTKVACFFLPAFVCCNSAENTLGAEVELYCYEVIDSVNSAFSVDLRHKIDSILQIEADYILTQKTADKGWPYFGSVGREKYIHSDSLMFPHTSKHRIVSSGTACDLAAKKLTILLKLDSSNNGILVSDMTWKREDGNWTILALPGQEHIDTSVGSLNKTGHHIANSAIRTTFK